MLESMLFGHEKGSFTGALQPNKGLIRAADEGTVLLDEISEMPLTLQAKLLRVIQEKKVMPIGSSVEVDVDVRIIATTNRNMSDEVKAGRFREDLYYRLNVFPLNTCGYLTVNLIYPPSLQICFFLWIRIVNKKQKSRKMLLKCF
ncbi:MAG: hypothetical protein CM15mP85_04260 [Rhodobacterales bacterium]|nr:MAG: hypothetical protein CM15mP85_04260 [Rhodobacterales bacterium]